MSEASQRSVATCETHHVEGISDLDDLLACAFAARPVVRSDDQGCPVHQRQVVSMLDGSIYADWADRTWVFVCASGGTWAGRGLRGEEQPDRATSAATDTVNVVRRFIGRGVSASS